MDQLPRLGKRELICLLLLTSNYVVSVWRGFLFLWVFGMGYVILLWHSPSLPLISFDDLDLKFFIDFGCFDIYEQLKFHAQLSLALKYFINQSFVIVLPVFLLYMNDFMVTDPW